MAPPTRTGSSADSISRAADQIVVSVGPYMFHRAAPRSRRRAATLAGKASPPESIRRSALPGQAASSSSRQVAGVACIAVTRWASSSDPRRCPSDAAARLARTTRAPTVSGRKISSTAMSNDSVVTARRTSSRPSPGARRIESRKFTTVRCGIWTPLGRPVEPEV